MKWRVMPSSRPGKRALVLLVGSIAFFTLFVVLVWSGERGGQTFFSNPVLTLTMLTSVLAAMAGGGFGVQALRRRDTSATVVLTVAVGALVALWTFLEVAFPH